MLLTPVLDRTVRRRLVTFAGALLLITAAGTVGFMVLEDWSLIESLYMTVITLSTVGFSEVRPLSPTGRLFTSGLIVAGVGSIAYLFGSMSEYILSGEFRGRLRSKRMQQRIDALSGHHIICGFGRVGRRVVEDLSAKRVPLVVVEPDSKLLEDAEPVIPHLIGDASDDHILKQAGIERAKGLVAATGDDASNIFITLTARNLNADLVIVARANQPATEPKLSKAGATHVVSPYAISGRRIATQLLHPAVTDFLDVVMQSGDIELWLEEITVREGSELSRQTIDATNVRARTGVNVLAVRRAKDGTVLVNPPSSTTLEQGEVLVALGTCEQLEELSALAGDEVHHRWGTEQGGEE